MPKINGFIQNTKIIICVPFNHLNINALIFYLIIVTEPSA